jgi:hypothetical protein
VRSDCRVIHLAPVPLICAVANIVNSSTMIFSRHADRSSTSTLLTRRCEMFKSMLAVLAVALCMSLSACGGSEAVAQSNGTCGKQLTDLQNALNTGAMTQDEYARAREHAIHNCNHD